MEEEEMPLGGMRSERSRERSGETEVEVEGPDTSMEARQDALKEFFDAGKAGDWSAAESALEDYLALRERED